MHTELIRWDTPISDAKSIQMVSLSDTSAGLVVILEDVRSPTRERVSIAFEMFVAYQNILEEYRNWGDWNIEGLGWTVVATANPWSVDIKQEPMVEMIHQDAKHYIIVTEDDVIDVLSDSSPIIEELGPTDPSAPPAGKSMVYYDPEDRQQIDQVIDEARGRKH